MSFHRQEQDAFRLNDRANESHSDQTSQAFLEELHKSTEKQAAKAGDSQVKIGDSHAGLTADHATGLMASLDRIQSLASSLPPEMLNEVVANNRGVIHKELLNGLEKSDKSQQQYDSFVAVLQQAFKGN